jgi:RNA polymerase sigma factor (sigma-70 family)
MPVRSHVLAAGLPIAARGGGRPRGAEGRRLMGAMTLRPRAPQVSTPRLRARAWEPAPLRACPLGVEAAVDRPLAFEHFYRTERPGLLRAVQFTIEDRDLATEAIDEAFVRAYERWDSVRAMGNPCGWVYMVAVNWARNRLRRRGVERRKPPHPELPRELEGVADPALAAAIAQLPLDQRSVVVMRFHLDWSVDEVAEALGVAPGTVKSRLHRALRRLESMLEERP